MWCLTFYFLARAYFYQGFEENKLGSESGTRVNDEEVHCGRKVLHNPDKLYVAEQTYINAEEKGQKLDVQTFPQVYTSTTKWLIDHVSYTNEHTASSQMNRELWMSLMWKLFHTWKSDVKAISLMKYEIWKYEIWKYEIWNMKNENMKIWKYEIWNMKYENEIWKMKMLLSYISKNLVVYYWKCCNLIG